MNRTTAILSTAFLASISLANASCDDTFSDDFIACEANALRVEGEVDGTPVSIKQSSEGGGFAQDNEGGEFGSQNNIRPDPSLKNLVNVSLEWYESINIGGSTEAKGTVIMPDPGPRAGETFCAGEGTMVHSDESGLRFLLKGLKGGAGCTQPVSGELRGCWRSE